MFSLNKSENIILKSLDLNQLHNLLNIINSTPLRFRRRLFLPLSLTFGNEIEVNDLSLVHSRFAVGLFNDIHDLEGNDKFVVHKEETADSEIVTPILNDAENNWSNLFDMYSMLYETGATIGNNTASHIHIGTHLINTPEKLSLLLKTLVVFESIIFKFGYGYDTEPRSFLQFRPSRSIFSVMMCPKRVKDFTDTLDNFKYNDQELMNSAFDSFLAKNLRFRPVFNFNDFCFTKLYSEESNSVPSILDHFEVRCFNGTLNPEIVQNNVNLIARIVIAVVEDRIDKTYVLSEYERYKKKRYNFDYFCAILDSETEGPRYNRLLNGFNKVKLDKALRLADMIFDTELDKCYFLKQYLKLFDAEPEYVSSLLK